MLCGAVVFMALATPLSAALADRVGRRPALLASAVLAGAVGLAMPTLLAQGPVGVFIFLSFALGVMGLTFAPLGALLPELFPTEVRYTGAASAYNLGGILGASLAPTLAQVLRLAGASLGSAITSPSPRSSAFSRSSACARRGARGPLAEARFPFGLRRLGEVRSAKSLSQWLSGPMANSTG